MRAGKRQLIAAIPAPSRRKTKCGMCNGAGTVAVDPRDYRKGARTCGQCGGAGEL